MKTLDWKKYCREHTFNANGVILWEGYSELDGEPIVVIATGLTTSSANPKTGSMIQTWILTEMHPAEALRSGADASICGDCVHRGVGGVRTCYVRMEAPAAVWRAYRLGRYARIEDLPVAQPHAALFGGRNVRLGSYGDPAAVPVWVWEMVVEHARMHTGYTHQWRSLEGAMQQRFAALCMASCDSEQDVIDAEKQGWRCFQVLPLDADHPEGILWCPSDPVRSRHVSCENCGACNGRAGRHRSHVVIYAHGPTKKRVGNAALPLVQ